MTAIFSRAANLSIFFKCYIVEFDALKGTHSYFLLRVHEDRNFSETCLNQILNKSDSCINRNLNKVLKKEIFVNLTCIIQTQKLVTRLILI